jgi:hypothetical protein
MTGYTFYILGHDGYLVGGTSVFCSDDADALARAKKLLGTFSAEVEVWDGARKVGHGGRSAGFSDATRARPNPLP